MKKNWLMIILVLAAVLAAPAVFAADDLAAKLQAALTGGADARFWQVSADDVQEMIVAKKTDFLVVDVRPSAADFKDGHIPGSIFIAPQDMFKPESLAKLPKSKTIILVCGTGQVQNIPLLGLRALGYDARTMRFGYTAWIKDYRGGAGMQDTIQNASAKNYPLEK